MHGIKIIRATYIINVLAQQQQRQRQGQLQTAQKYRKNTQNNGKHIERR